MDTLCSSDSEVVARMMRNPRIVQKVNELSKSDGLTLVEAAKKYHSDLLSGSIQFLMDSEMDVSPEDSICRECKDKPDQELLTRLLDYYSYCDVTIPAGVRHNISLEDQAKKLLKIGDYPITITQMAKRLIGDSKHQEAIEMLSKYDIHHRKIANETQLMKNRNFNLSNKDCCVNRVVEEELA